ncbi:MAG TPA: YbhB/YbcL family Raf kinase inhibitor-like protein [Verrucomicrobiae bacterium]|nr:YbhB/YbcL family Raf kinase inhibitor-like protein [Verrucomicrobiae bacterium]
MPDADRWKLVRNSLLVLGCFLCITACSIRPAQKETAAATLDLTSADFAAGATIPKNFTCDGGDSSPALAWKAPPERTQSFALIADDPDAPVGTWVHWVIFNIPATSRALAQNYPKDEQSVDGTRQGKNDFDKTGYGGPCPPPGKVHRYFFKLYALDTKLNLNAGATKKDLEHAIQGHVLARGEYVGRYSH